MDKGGGYKPTFLLAGIEILAFIVSSSSNPFKLFIYLLTLSCLFIGINHNFFLVGK